jgi:chromosome segregation ATPase
MNDKQKVFWRNVFERTLAILVGGLVGGLIATGIWTTAFFAYNKQPKNQSIIGQIGSLVQKIRQIDNVLEQYGKDIRTGFDNLQTGITELKGLTESNTGRISRIEKGTGKAVGESESIIERLTGISETIGELRKSIEGEGNIGEEFRREIDSIRKELENIQGSDNW